MSTFSLYTGTNKETIGYFLGGSYSIGSTYVDVILDSLKDNDTKSISEFDIRNSVFSLASSFIFKETKANGSTYSYIGVDNLNLNSSRDVSGFKFLLGKRSYSGTYSYSTDHDIFNIASTYSLLNSDTDVFLYNTRNDEVLNNSTIIRFLAGKDYTGSVLQTAPYIQSEIIESGNIDALSLDFINRNGDITVRSDYGTISIYNPTNPSYSISFPSISNSSSNLGSKKVLKWGNDGLYWEEIFFPNYGYLGATGVSLNLHGDLYFNNSLMEFDDSRKVPISFNEIKIGQSFNRYPIESVLRRLIYPYLKPSVSISIDPPYDYGYVEVGTYPTPTVSFIIQKKTLDTQPALLYNMIPGQYSSVSSNKYETVVGSSNGIVISPIADESTVFTISVSDGVNTASASTSITGIYPYFYGYSDLSIMTNIGLLSLNKLVEIKSNKVLDTVGNGNFYFIYDYDYGTLSNIYDNYGNICTASFSVSDQLYSSPTGLWAGKRFYVYQWDSVTQSIPSKNFQFEY